MLVHLVRLYLFKLVFFLYWFALVKLVDSASAFNRSFLSFSPPCLTAERAREYMKKISIWVEHGVILYWYALTKDGLVWLLVKARFSLLICFGMVDLDGLFPGKNMVGVWVCWLLRSWTKGDSIDWFWLVYFCICEEHRHTICFSHFLLPCLIA